MKRYYYEREVMVNRVIFFAVAALGVIVIVGMTAGQVEKKAAVADSRYLRYDGVLTDHTGRRIAGDITMTFSIFESPNSTTSLWQENHRVRVEDGKFEVLLGRHTSLAQVDEGSYFLGISIDGEEMLPRQEVTISQKEFGPSHTAGDLSDVRAWNHGEPFELRDNDWNYWDNPPHMFSIAGGNVGIGTTEPASELDVNGTVTMKGFNLTSDSMRIANLWADTVFFADPNPDHSADFYMTIDTSTFSPVMDEALVWGYNVSARTPNTPALWYNIEANYWNGTDSLMEVNLNYYSDEMTFKRPYLLEIDRQTDSVEQFFYSDDLRIIGSRFSYYPDETTGIGFVGFNRTNVLVADTADWGGFKMQNWEGSGIIWGMHVEDDTQKWWLGLPEKTTRYVEIDTMGNMTMTGDLTIDSPIYAKGGSFVDDDGDSIMFNTVGNRGIKVVYTDDEGYAVDIESDSDGGILLDIDGTATSGILLPLDPTVSDGSDYFGINMRIADGYGANFKAHGIKISGSSFDSPDEHLLELHDADSDGSWGVNVERATHELRFYYDDSLIVGFDTLGIDSTSIADGSLTTADLKDSLITGSKIGYGVVESAHLADNIELVSARFIADSLHYWDENVNGTGYDFRFIYNGRDTFTIDTTGVIDGSEILSSSSIDIDSLDTDHIVVNSTLNIPTYTDTITGSADTLLISGMTDNGLISLSFLEDFTTHFCVYKADTVIVHTSTALSKAPYRYGILAY